MPTRDRKRKAQKKINYDKNKELILAQRKDKYASNSAPQREYSREYHRQNKASRNTASQQYYNSHKDEQQHSYHKYYASHVEERRVLNKQYYKAHKEDLQALSKVYFENNRTRILLYQKAYYQKNKEKIKAARKLYYASHRAEELADTTSKSLYLRRTHNHFTVVQSTVLLASQPPQGDWEDQGDSKGCEKTNMKGQSQSPDHPAFTGVWPDLGFHTVDQKWQESKCQALNLPFHAHSGAKPGGPHMVLTRPDHKGIHHIRKDGNCLFRCFSHLLTGEERHYDAVRKALVAHMYDIPDYVADPNSTTIDRDVAGKCSTCHSEISGRIRND